MKGFIAGAACILIAAIGAFYCQSGRVDFSVESYLLDRAGDDIGIDRIEDAEPNASWRAELFQVGFNSISEARVDLDRDDLIDQRWEFFSDGRIRRHISSQDDGHFDRVEDRTHDDWIEALVESETRVDEASVLALDDALAELEPNEATETSEDARHRSDAELYLLMQQGRNLELRRMENAEPGKPWHVVLLQEEGDTITGAELDLDRDGHVDQRWAYDGEERISRELIAPTATTQQRWTPGGWRDE